MQFERFDLLARVVEGQERARYDLSSSDMPSLRLFECGGLEDRPLAENHPGGGAPLREELARAYGGRAEDYLVTAGASEANFAACAALLDSGARVLVEHPTYQPLVAIPRALGAAVTSLPRSEDRGFRLTVGDVRDAMPESLRLLILTNLNNPTGVALEATDVRAIADLARERGFYVLVDEIFRELSVDRDIPTMGGLNDHVIVTSSLSKCYGAGGLKIGWVRAAEPTRERIRSVLDYLSGTPAGTSEPIALSVLKNRSKTLARNRHLIEDGRKVAREWASAEPDLIWHDPLGHLTFPGVGVDSTRLADLLLQEYDTFIAPAESFGMTAHFRLNIGKGAESLHEGLAQVSKARARLR